MRIQVVGVKVEEVVDQNILSPDCFVAKYTRLSYIYRVSQKTHFQNAVGATVHWLNQCLEINFLVVSY